MENVGVISSIMQHDVHQWNISKGIQLANFFWSDAGVLPIHGGSGGTFIQAYPICSLIYKRQYF